MKLKKSVKNFSNSKLKDWYFDQIPKLTDRWQKVVENDLYFGEQLFVLNKFLHKKENIIIQHTNFSFNLIKRFFFNLLEVSNI